MMVRVSSRITTTEHLTYHRTLPIETRRGHSVDSAMWGMCDLPIRLNDTFIRGRDEIGVYWEKADPSPYELQVMWVWGSWKAMMGMMMEQDVVEGLGVRVAFELARENP